MIGAHSAHVSRLESTGYSSQDLFEGVAFQLDPELKDLEKCCAVGAVVGRRPKNRARSFSKDCERFPRGTLEIQNTVREDVLSHSHIPALLTNVGNNFWACQALSLCNLLSAGKTSCSLGVLKSAHLTWTSCKLRAHSGTSLSMCDVSLGIPVPRAGFLLLVSRHMPRVHAVHVWECCCPCCQSTRKCQWLGSYKRAHVMHSFAPTCILFVSDMVLAKTVGNDTIESVPAVLRLLIHAIGWDSCFKQ